MQSSVDIIKSIKNTAWSAEPISLDLVRSWMLNSDIQVLGAVWGFILTDADTWARIYPALSTDESDYFMFGFYERCLKEDPQGKYAPNRQQTADEILRWFWYRDEHVFEKRFLLIVKQWLEKAYLAGDEESRAAIVNITLRGLFDRQKWRERFNDWLDHPVLREAYIPAAEAGAAHSRANETTIDRIKAAAASSDAIPGETARKWLESSELEVLGAAWRLITTSQSVLERIDPALTNQEIDKFCFRFFERCLQFETQDSDWDMNRYLAASKIRHMFWSREGYEFAVQQFKEWLTQAYLRVNPFARRAIAYNTLGVLFREDKWRELFNDWADHPDLCEVYAQACEEETLYAAPNEVREIEIKFLVDNAEIVPQETVRQWMKSEDIEVIGALFELVITKPASLSRIQPLFTKDEVNGFYFSFYERCLWEDPDGGWSLSRFEASRDIFMWYAHAAEDDGDTIGFLTKMKDWLADVYMKADKDIRRFIVGGALEHILEEPRWQVFFRDWQDHPSLVEAYATAMKWAKEHER